MLGWQGGTSTGLEEHTESLVLLAVESGGWSFHSALLWHANVAVSCALGKDCRVTMIQRCPLKKHDDSKMMSIICIYITHNRWDNNLSISMIFCDNLSIYIYIYNPMGYQASEMRFSLLLPINQGKPFRTKPMNQCVGTCSKTTEHINKELASLCCWNLRLAMLPDLFQMGRGGTQNHIGI